MSRLTAKERPDYTLPDGRVFAPVERLAVELSLHPRTLKRKPNLAIIKIGGAAYVERSAALLALVGEKAPKRAR
jgi:hypothetical protein